MPLCRRRRSIREERYGEFSVAKLSSERGKLNVAITDLAIKPELVAREVPVSLSVTVQNLSDQDADNLDLTLRVTPASEFDPSKDDGGEAQLGEVLRLAARDSATRQLAYRFDSAGYHTVIAEVRSDGLVVDNRRFLVVPVQEDVGVLLVDGDPTIEATERETFFLEFALSPKDDDLGALGNRFTPFLPSTITVDQMSDIDWKKFSVVVLANVAEVPKAAITGLERYVAEGGALVVFLGENVRPEFYNEFLYKDGSGLLPLEMGVRRGDRRTPVHLQFAAPNHPVARYFEEHKASSYLQGGVVSFYEYFQFAEPTTSATPAERTGNAGDAVPGGAPDVERDVSVLCRLNDIDRSPVIFDASYGRGRVMWFASTADRDWNGFPVWHDYVVFLYESISYLMGFGAKSLNLDVGESFSRFYDSGDFASEVLLTVPPAGSSDLESARVLRRAMREIKEERRFQISYDDTAGPGLYRLDLRRPFSERGDSVECFAVNVDPEEGRLESLTAAEFKEHYRIEPTLFDASAQFRDLAKQKDLLRGREYWPWFLVAVLILLLLETALAQHFGRRSR